MYDMCSHRENITSPCFLSYPMSRITYEEFFSAYGAPLQLGGTAQSLSDITGEPIRGLSGCISNLRVNNELMDLGEPGFQTQSHAGCHTSQHKSSCHLLISHRSCDCQKRPGNPLCPQISSSVTLKQSSYMKGVLSSVQNSYRTEVSVLVRTYSDNGLILRIPSRNETFSLDLTINDGILCWSLVMLLDKSKDSKMSLSKDPTMRVLDELTENMDFLKPKKDDISPKKFTTESLCLMKHRVSDGVWHRITAGWFGPVLILNLDDGSDFLHNETFINSEERIALYHSLEDFHGDWLDVRTGVIIGGLPMFDNSTLTVVNQDLHDACLSDLWISGNHIPLSPHQNETSNGQIVAAVNVIDGCELVNTSSCSSEKICVAPFKCLELDGQTMCGCEDSFVFTPIGCKKMDICQFQPCLNGGFCSRGSLNFQCSCSSRFRGPYCEKQVDHNDLNMSVAVLVPILLTILLLFALVCGLMKLRRILGNTDDESSCKDGKELSVSCIQLKEQPKIIARTLEDLSECCARDDVRNYAYEGGESSNESFGSVFQDLQAGSEEYLSQSAKMPFAEVVDLLRELPDATVVSRAHIHPKPHCPVHDSPK